MSLEWGALPAARRMSSHCGSTAEGTIYEPFDDFVMAVGGVARVDEDDELASSILLDHDALTPNNVHKTSGAPQGQLHFFAVLSTVATDSVMDAIPKESNESSTEPSTCGS